MRSLVMAEVKPTSAKVKVKDLAEFCQLITTRFQEKNVHHFFEAKIYLLQWNHQKVDQPIRRGHWYIFS